jgi:hypothetical protein
MLRFFGVARKIAEIFLGKKDTAAFADKQAIGISYYSKNGDLG